MVLASYCVVELIFLLITLILRAHMNEISHNPPPSYPRKQKVFIKRILSRLEKLYAPNDRQAVCDFLSGWCLGAKFEEIRKGNIVRFLSWAMYAKKDEHLMPSEREEIEDFFVYLKGTHGLELPEGYNESVRCATLSLDPVYFLPRPVLVYVLFKCMEVLKFAVLTLVGFSHMTTSNGMTYYYRPSSSPHPPRHQSQQPFVFFHGIAPCGCLFYIPMVLLGLVRSAPRAVFLFENQAVSMTMSMKVHGEFDVVHAVKEALDMHCGRRVKICLVGHSLGSCPVTWLTRNLSEKIGVILLLDPVTLFLSHPAVAVNFVYKRTFANIFEWIIYLGASSELFISHYLKRHFWWYRNELWLEEVPKSIKVIVALSREDEIVDSPLCEFGLKKQKELGDIGDNVSLMMFEGGHAMMIAMPATWRQISAELKAVETGKRE